MKKNLTVKIVLWCAVVLWMSVIFSFSAQDATESLEMSDGVLDVVIRLVDGQFDTLSPEEQAARCEQLSFYIRKAAHFSVFAILGALTAAAISCHTASKQLTASVSAMICVLYAVSDEIHQYFVPGRACRLFDVCVDSLGAFLGIAAVLLVMYKTVKKRIK